MLDVAALMAAVGTAANGAADAVPAAAKESDVLFQLTGAAFAWLGAVLGAGLIVMGAAKGIGNIAGKATEAIARQPEAGGRIFTTMIIAAALIEGVTLFALVICVLAVLKQ